MIDLPAYFDDPLDPPRSLQLNQRHWPDESYRNLDILREADDDATHLRFRALKKSLRPVKALLPARFHRKFLARLVYSMVYRVWFQPIRFSMKLSEAFIRANSYSGPEAEFYKGAAQVDELRYIVDLVHSIYRDHYGSDALKSDFAVRYMNSRNESAVRRMTEYGDFSDFHFDEGKDFTCIIYLCPVTHDNGCFTYVDQSPLIPKSHLIRALHQVVEFDMKLALPDQKKDLALELRGSMAIGNYLDAPKVEQLRQNVVEVTGNAGDGIIFNGFDTLHRGGKPVKGERTAVFISTKGLFHKRLVKAAYDQLAYLWL